MLATHPDPVGRAVPSHRPRHRMPFRHKLMLLLACEIVLLGVRLSERNPYHVGVVIEVPAHAHHVIT